MLRVNKYIVNRGPKKTLKKPYENTKTYTESKEGLKKLLDSCLTPTDFQRFQPYSMDEWLNLVIATDRGENLIVKKNGCRAQRHRDKKKGVFINMNYLGRHPFGTDLKVDDPSNAGVYQVSWAVGDKMRIREDESLARRYGPEYHYMPTYLVKFKLLTIKATCRLLIKLYDEDITFKEFVSKLRQTVYAIHEKQCRGKMTGRLAQIVINSLLNMVEKGRNNHLAGGSFGRRVGRPNKRVTALNINPRLFDQEYKSKDLTREANKKISILANRNKVKITKKLKHTFHLGAIKYRASKDGQEFLKCNIGMASRDVVVHCFNESYRAMNNSFKFVCITPQKPVQKANRNTAQYSSPTEIDNSILNCRDSILPPISESKQMSDKPPKGPNGLIKVSKWAKSINDDPPEDSKEKEKIALDGWLASQTEGQMKRGLEELQNRMKGDSASFRPQKAPEVLPTADQEGGAEAPELPRKRPLRTIDRIREMGILGDVDPPEGSGISDDEFWYGE